MSGTPPKAPPAADPPAEERGAVRAAVFPVGVDYYPLQEERERVSIDFRRVLLGKL